jgi:hypothetical protein
VDRQTGLEEIHTGAVAGRSVRLRSDSYRCVGARRRAKEGAECGKEKWQSGSGRTLWR